jgi:hypothetical protein
VNENELHKFHELYIEKEADNADGSKDSEISGEARRSGF